MRKLSSLVLALGLVALSAGSSEAVPRSLSSATLSVLIGSLPSIAIAWTGTGSADVTATDIANLSAGIFAFTGTTPVTDPAVAPIKGVNITGAANGVGNFAFVAGAGGGIMAVPGTSNVCLFAVCSAAIANVSVPFTTGGVNGVGLGGAPIPTAPGALVSVTLTGTPWTTGAASVGLASVTGTPFDGDSVTLVTATTINTDIAASSTLPSFAILHLQFAAVPEPGTLLLVGSGLAGLAALGRRRERS
jgi:hypothetical protein